MEKQIDKEKTKKITWKWTMQDGYLPFTDVDESFKELRGSALTHALKKNEKGPLKFEKDEDCLF